ADEGGAAAGYNVAMANERIRVFILERHPAIRAGLRALLESSPEIVVVGEAGDSAGILTHIMATQPDIVLLDPDLPDDGGLPLLRELSAALPAASLLVHTDDGASAKMQAAFAAGVQGYLLKGQSSQKLVQTIRLLYASRVDLTANQDLPD
ncbi:MAG: response regulator transcription factor, partial [Anaerolineales bacterium]|nr:response regulator transcription factor [Anaerolineales bacterium]